MSKFDTLYTETGTRIAATGLDMYPEDYRGKIADGGLYGRYALLVGGNDRSDHGEGRELDGMMMVRIFYARGERMKDALNFADTLDTYFEDFKDGGLYFGGSQLSSPQDDPENEALALLEWQVPFMKYF